MIRHNVINVTDYKGITEDEYNKLKYYLNYCIELSDGDIRSFQASYENGSLSVKGFFIDRVLCEFYSNGFFDEDKMKLTIISTIIDPNGEKTNSTDTFNFLGDTIVVESNTAELGKNRIEIPYYHASLKR